eukprot:m.198849 g.198849  ORF g.198849 m.198849 type:complete len:483 (-) comp25153_c0_seq1:146-1594(-)
MPTTAQVQQDRAERMSILVERGLTDGQIHTAFSRYDVGKNGTLEVDEVAAALSTLSLRRDTDTAALFDRLDRNHDGRVQYNEFAAFVKEKEGELRELYCHLDVDGNGVLSRDEILAALDTLGLKADAQRLDAMITAMDSDSDGAISFSDFRTMLLLFPSTTHHRVFDAWTAAASVSIADAVFEVPTASSHGALPAHITLLSGAAAGVVSRTCTAPFDRLKVLMQADGIAKGTGAITGLRELIRTQGLKSMWNGNGVNVVKVAPESALKFFVYDQVKAVLCRDPSNPQLHERFLSGATAGAISQTAIYPLEVIKTTVTIAPPGRYANAMDCARQSIKNGGWRVLYRGLVPATIGIIPFAGTDLMLYNTLKDTWVARYPDVPPSALTVLAMGASASMVAQLVSYPLAVVRTRMQVPRDPASAGPHPTTLAGFVRTIYDAGGIRGFYRGLAPNFMKAIPSVSLSYLIFEKTKQAFVTTPNLVPLA